MQELETLLQKWVSKAKRFRDAHYHASARLRRMHYLMGMPAIVLSATLSTAIFATLEREIDVEIRVVVALVTVASAIFSALHTFLRYAERAEAHRQAYVGFESVIRSMEASLAFRMTGEQLQHAVEKIRKSLDDLNQAPELSNVDRSYAHLDGTAHPSLPMLPSSLNLPPAMSGTPLQGDAAASAGR